MKTGEDFKSKAEEVYAMIRFVQCNNGYSAKELVVQAIAPFLAQAYNQGYDAGQELISQKSREKA